MEDNKRLLEIRNQMKARKPKFMQQDTHKKAKLDERWRKPKGIDSKLRLNLSGKRKKPSKGYRSPEKARGLSRNGLRQIMVCNIKQLEAMDAKNEGAIISSALGVRKRVEMLKKADEMKITILNIKNPQEYIQSIENRIQQKKAEKQEKEKKKETKKKDKEKKAAEKEKKKEEKGDELSNKVEEEEKKKEEKKEMDRTLIHTS